MFLDVGLYIVLPFGVINVIIRSILILPSFQRRTEGWVDLGNSTDIAVMRF